MTAPVWNPTQLDCYPQADNEADVVFCVHWDCTASDGEYNGRVYSTVPVTLDTKAPFTPYDQLTKEQVISWVKDTLGAETVAATEAAVLQQIENQKNPKMVSPALPWL